MNETSSFPPPAVIDPAAFAVALARLRARVAAAANRAGRDPASVRILPVTKTHGPDAVRLAVEAGLAAVGENRVQEVESKRPLSPAGARFELIGHLQSNKAKRAVACCDRVQTVDSVDLARRLGRLAGEFGKVLPVLVQVNAGRDPAKSGAEPEEAGDVAAAVRAEPALRLEGLMTIAPLSDDPAVARRTFAALRAIRDGLEPRLGIRLPELSMGMSGDLEAAVEEGSTLIRVGTLLFGSR